MHMNLYHVSHILTLQQKPPPPPPVAPKPDETQVQTLMDMGFTRRHVEEAFRVVSIKLT